MFDQQSQSRSGISRREMILASSAGFAALATVQPLWADDAETAKTHADIVAKGIDFLKNSQAADGSFTKFVGIGPTILATSAMLRNGIPVTDKTVAKSLKYLEEQVREDGGIYSSGSRFRNYETCVAVTCFKEANVDGRYDKVVAGADKYLKGLQWSEDRDVESSDFKYGGGGYGKNSRPDLSNTAFLVDALKAAGNGPDSQAMKRALVFVSRCQNLESEHNTTPLANKVNDGGFYYSITDADKNGRGPQGGLRSYGSMTYAGLKSMIYAGLGPDDKRVKAATKWISDHYTVTENPGMGKAGLFYYYHTFAKSLSVLGNDEIVDKDGVKHNWRADLTTELAKLQQKNGSWVNKNPQWLEGDANLATGFALLALSYAKPK